jgi:hypothetical protein
LPEQLSLFSSTALTAANERNDRGAIACPISHAPHDQNSRSHLRIICVSDDKVGIERKISGQRDRRAEVFEYVQIKTILKSCFENVLKLVCTSSKLIAKTPFK